MVSVMNTYRFICALADGRGFARTWRNFRNDRAALEAAEQALIEGRYESVTVKHGAAIVGQFVDEPSDTDGDMNRAPEWSGFDGGEPEPEL
jgi:hypothetical protein